MPNANPDTPERLLREALQYLAEFHKPYYENDCKECALAKRIDAFLAQPPSAEPEEECQYLEECSYPDICDKHHQCVWPFRTLLALNSAHKASKE